MVDAYPDQFVEPPAADQTTKRTKYYERSFREQHSIGFSKRRVAETVKRLLGDGKADNETVENLRKVTHAIWETLQRQVRTT